MRRTILVTNPERARLRPGKREQFGHVAPAGLPPAIVTKLNAAIAETLRAPDVRKQLQDMGYEPEANSPQAMTALFRDDIATWGKVIKAPGTKVE